MELIIILFCIIFIFCIYILSGKDIMSPSIMLCLGYIIATLSCTMNKEEWNVEIQSNTVILLCTGIFSFVLAEIYIHLLKKKKLETKRKKEKKEIKISNFKIIACIIINLITAYLYLKEIIRISGGGDNFFEMMNLYRKAYSYENISISTFPVQMMKVSKGIGYVFLYIFINNIFASKDKIYKQFKYIIPSITYVLGTFLIGGRLNMIAYVIAIIFLSYYNWNEKNNWEKTINIKILRNIILTFVLFIILFYSTKTIVGRDSKRDFFDYVTTYLGGSIQLLDEYLNSGYIISSDRIETFPGIVQSLNKLGITNLNARKSLEFRHKLDDGEFLGNVYTGIRRYYNDFGIIGVIIIQILFSLFFNIIYMNIKNKNTDTAYSIFRVVFYSYSLFSIITQAIEDHFFIDLCIGYIIEMIIIYIIIKFLIPNKRIEKEII